MTIFPSRRVIKGRVYWYARCKLPGGRELKPMRLRGVTTEEEARAEVDALRAQVAKGRDPFGAAVGLEEWVDEYLDVRKVEVEPNTLKDETVRLKRWQRWMRANFPGVHSPGQLKREHLEQYRLERLAVSAAAWNKARAYLRLLFKWGKRRRVLTEDLLEDLTKEFEPETDTVLLERDEIKALHAKLPAHLRPALELAYATGMRPGELCRVEWSDFDFRRGLVTVRNKPSGKVKTKRQRRIWLPKEVLERFAELAAARAVLQFVLGRELPTGLFLNARGLGPLTPATWRAAMQVGAGRKGFGGYAMRHSSATHRADAGVQIEVLQELLGHSTILMTRRYVKVSEERQKAAAEALNFSDVLGETPGVNPKASGAK